MHVVHKYEGMYNKDLNERLYLIPEEEITSEQYTMIKTYLGVYGPGRQVTKEKDKYYFRSDESTTKALNKVKEELAELGQVYPEAV